MTAKHEAALTTAMVALTVTTGMVEAVSFLTLGPVFTAVQTGNTLFLGFAVAGAGGFSAVASTASLVGFAAGALLGARLESGIDVRGRRWFVVALVAESVLLGIAGLVAWEIERLDDPLSSRHYAVAALVALAMGMRSVTTLRASVADLPTTRVTRAMTASSAPRPWDSAQRSPPARAPSSVGPLRSERCSPVGCLAPGCCTRPCGRRWCCW